MDAFAHPLPAYASMVVTKIDDVPLMRGALEIRMVGANTWFKGQQTTERTRALLALRFIATPIHLRIYYLLLLSYLITYHHEVVSYYFDCGACLPCWILPRLFSATLGRRFTLGHRYHIDQFECVREPKNQGSATRGRFQILARRMGLQGLRIHLQSGTIYGQPWRRI